MGWLSSIFPGPAVAGEVLKGATDLIDKAFYTDQEKAGDAAKAKREAVDQYLRWLEATSGQNRARRAIAIVVTGLWAMTWILSFIVSLAMPWVPAIYTVRMQQSMDQLQAAGGDISGPFMLVLGFYFSGRVITGGIKHWKQAPRGEK